MTSERAFIVAYPLLRAARAATPRSRNRLVHGPGHPDTRRITGWLDLGPEPVVLATPDTRGRYYGLSLRDAWGSAFASVGARTTGTAEHVFGILGPRHHGEQLPLGVVPIAAPTRIVRLTGTLEAHGTRDAALPLAGFRVAPLSHWRRQHGGSPSVPASAAPVLTDPLDSLDARAWRDELSRLVDDNPPPPVERACVHELLSTAYDPALQRSLGAARGAIAAAAAGPFGDDVGGWQVHYDRDGSDPLLRAALAARGCEHEPAVDELAAVVDTTADGATLSGGERYLLRFPADGHPPVNAFWSLTARAQPPETTAGGCHFTGDLHGLALDGDGSLPVHIQRARPPRTREANWLPAPPGRFSLELRLYWPRDEALDGRWSPPAVTRVGQLAPLPSDVAPAR